MAIGTECPPQAPLRISEGKPLFHAPRCGLLLIFSPVNFLNEKII